MLSNVKVTLGNAFGLLMVSRNREEYREKLKNAVDTIALYVSDSISEYTLLDELHNAMEKLEEGLGTLLNGSRKSVKRAKAFAIAWLLAVGATLCDRRFGILFDIM